MPTNFTVEPGQMTLSDQTGVLDVVQVGPDAGDLPSDRFGTSSWTRLFDGTQDSGTDRMDFSYTAVATPGS